MVNVAAKDDREARPEAPAEEAGAPLESVLRILAASGKLTAKMRQSAQRAAGVIRPGERVIGAYRCGISVGTSEREGVAVVTSERLSVFDRRGWVSVDQGFQHRWSTPFTIDEGAGPTLVTITPTGATPISLDLIDPQHAEEFCRQLEALRPAVIEGEEGEQGWWTQVQTWPGPLGSLASWSYLGGDSRLPEPEVGLGLQIGPGGVTLAEAEKTLLLAAWQDVQFIHVVGLETAFQRAAARGLTGSPAFAGSWNALQNPAFVVIGDAAGEQAFFATTDVATTELRARLIPLAAAMPPAADDRPTPPSIPTAPSAPVPPAATAVAPTPAATPDSSGTADLATQLERLAALHERGMLDDAEFARAKAALFS
jgi:hypothetical protein